MPRRTQSIPEQLACDQLLDLIARLIARRTLHRAEDPPCRDTTPRQVPPQHKIKQSKTVCKSARSKRKTTRRG
jgi:hypothetical protein